MKRKMTLIVFSLAAALTPQAPAQTPEAKLDRTVLVNGQKVASGRVERTQGMVFSADETAGVGMDDATPLTTDYKERDNAFTGKILKVTIDVKAIGLAVKAEADTGKCLAAVKKALSD